MVDCDLFYMNCLVVLPGVFVKTELISKKIWSSLSAEQVILQRMTEGAQEAGVLWPEFFLLVSHWYQCSCIFCLQSPQRSFHLCCGAPCSVRCSARRCSSLVQQWPFKGAAELDDLPTNISVVISLSFLGVSKAVTILVDFWWKGMKLLLSKDTWAWWDYAWF